MERYFLNDTEIMAPQGIDGLTRHKTRSRRYFSVLYKNVGYANGIGNVTFTDAVSRGLLLAPYQTARVAANTRFRMETGGVTDFDAYVDYATFSRDRDGITCAFRDSQDITTLESQSATAYALPATERILLTPKALSSAATHVLNAATATMQRSSTDARPIDHALPVQRPPKAETTLPGELMSVSSPLTMPPIYRNTTPDVQSLLISGQVAALVSASASVNARLVVQVYAPNGSVEEILQGEFLVTTSATSKTLLIHASLLVQPGGWVAVSVRSADSVTRFQFTYDAVQTTITLESAGQAPESVCTGLSAFTLLSELVRKSSLGKLTLISHYFTTGEGRGLFITNGANLRGVNKVITASLQDVFDGLTAPLCLAMWVDGNRVYIETLPEYLRNRTKTSRLEQEPIRVKYIPNADYLASEVLTGFEEWKGTTGLSGDEFNGTRQYLSRLTNLRKTLDLRSRTLIASGTLIEEQRRKQFASASASSSSSDSYDEKLFVISTTPGRNEQPTNETRQQTPILEGVADFDTPYNVNLSPARSLKRWGAVLPLAPLVLESGLGNTSMRSRRTGEAWPIGEDDPLPATTHSLLGDELAEVTMPMTQQEFNSLGDWVTLNDSGEWITGLLMEATWSITLEEGGICQMQLFL